MTILGTRVGQIPVPLSPGKTACPRCGCIYSHNTQNVVAGSPCLDCREILRLEGDTTVWRRQNDYPDRKP